MSGISLATGCLWWLLVLGLTWPQAVGVTGTEIIIFLVVSLWVLIRSGAMNMLRAWAAGPFVLLVIAGLGLINAAQSVGPSLTGTSLGSSRNDLLGTAYWMLGSLLILSGGSLIAMLLPLPGIPRAVRRTAFAAGSAASFALALVFVGAVASTYDKDISYLNLFLASVFGAVAFASGLVALSFGDPATVAKTDESPGRLCAAAGSDAPGSLEGQTDAVAAPAGPAAATTE